MPNKWIEICVQFLSRLIHTEFNIYSMPKRRIFLQLLFNIISYNRQSTENLIKMVYDCVVDKDHSKSFDRTYHLQHFSTITERLVQIDKISTTLCTVIRLYVVRSFQKNRYHPRAST